MSFHLSLFLRFPGRVPLRSYNGLPVHGSQRASSQVKTQFQRAWIRTDSTQLPTSKRSLTVDLTSVQASDVSEIGEINSLKQVRMNDISRLFSLVRPEAWSLGLALFCLGVSSAVAMCIPFSVGKILDLTKDSDDENGRKLVSYREKREKVRLYGFTFVQVNAILAGVFMVGATAHFGRVYILRVVGERVVARLRSQLYKRTILQDAGFFDANKVGDLLSRFSSDANIVAKSLTQNIADGLRALVTGTAGLIMMGWVSMELTAIIIAALPPVAVGAYYYGRRIRDITTRSQQTLGRSTRVAEETLNGIETVQAFSAELTAVRNYNNEIRNIYHIGKEEAQLSASFFSATNLIGNLTLLTVLSAGTSMIMRGDISIGDLSSFMMYSAYTGSAMIGLSSFYSKMMKGLGASKRVFELEDSVREIRSTAGQPVRDIDSRGPIAFDHVQFSYPTRSNSPVFRNLSFTVAAGSNVCVVGPSGGGKTTVSKLLMRYYDPQGGRVTLNGRDIREYNLQSFRRHIGIVGQSPVLFSGTIAENIAFGYAEATKQEIEDAARQANCESMLSDFADGLNTQVGPRGAQLSGGQKQRIAIARALIRKPSILILDEATSALDAESESAVTDALAGVIANRGVTTISISHRLAAIRRSDMVIVLDSEGDVAETGRFQDLVADEGSYFMRVLT
ncbi:P-loop containing nucleoside triphosphate hydrolase protein [Lipomyces oligophaga]|uniref:P-loop containing nucleoside triphosphate hydrolase protein n=1 Tax=Lipomyces oligophaga TaxID=45792 RepID=UPI0034CE4D4C